MHKQVRACVCPCIFSNPIARVSAIVCVCTRGNVCLIARVHAPEYMIALKEEILYVCDDTCMCDETTRCLKITPVTTSRREPEERARGERGERYLPDSRLCGWSDQPRSSLLIVCSFRLLSPSNLPPPSPPFSSVSGPTRQRRQALSFPSIYCHIDIFHHKHIVTRFYNDLFVMAIKHLQFKDM